MGYTLDQLLDATGVSDLSGKRLTKKASADDGYKLSKLAERCRRAVDATPDEHVESSQRELIEKTAAVAIIGRTLAEIEEINGSSPEVTKTASAQSGPSREQFINTALNAGHSPYEIAEFLEKTAVFKRLGRALATEKAVRSGRSAAKINAKSMEKGERGIRNWQDVIRKHKDVPDSQKNALLSRMRRELGEERAAKLFDGGAGQSFKNLDSFKDLQRAAPKPTGPAAFKASANVGGATYGVTDKQLKAAKKPALYAGAGYMGHRALTGDKEKKSGSSGPVIITR